MGAEDVHAELPDIIAGRAASRESQDKIILYISPGIWGEHVAILLPVYRQAKELGFDTRPAS
jgi:ornithine cyclodeaminase/alanine dehydrogenase-like protein (mu-crystallin family)